MAMADAFPGCWKSVDEHPLWDSREELPPEGSSLWPWTVGPDRRPVGCLDASRTGRRRRMQCQLVRRRQSEKPAALVPPDPGCASWEAGVRGHAGICSCRLPAPDPRRARCGTWRRSWRHAFPAIFPWQGRWHSPTEKNPPPPAGPGPHESPILRFWPSWVKPTLHPKFIWFCDCFGTNMGHLGPFGEKVDLY